MDAEGRGGVKVFLDVSAVRYPLTGIGRYVFELSRHLPIADPALQIEYVAGASRSELPPALPVAGDAAVAPGKRAARLKAWLAHFPVVLRAHDWLSSFRLLRALGGESGVFHGPQFRLPRLGVPGVVTIHDLSVYSWADCHPAARVAATRMHIESALRRANHVITDSAFTRQELIDKFGLPERAVSAVSLACSEDFHPRNEADLESLLRVFGLQYRSFAFFSGTIEPRKNIDRLIDAYSRLPLALRMQHPLVLCGYRGWKSDDTHARISRAQAEGWLRYLGYVDEQVLPQLFAAARLFVFPSLYEGFGLPVLEAMASGVPVLCAASASLPEVAGDAALLFEPQDVDGLTEGLLRGLEDTHWQAEAQARGLARAAVFSWQRCAAETAGIYRRVWSA